MKRKKLGKKENIGKKIQEGLFAGYNDAPFSEDVLLENKVEEVFFYEGDLNFEEDLDLMDFEEEVEFDQFEDFEKLDFGKLKSGIFDEIEDVVADKKGQTKIVEEENKGRMTMDDIFNRMMNEGIEKCGDEHVDEVEHEYEDEDTLDDEDCEQDVLFRRMDTLGYTGRSYRMGSASSESLLLEKDQVAEIVVKKVYKDKSVKVHRVKADEVDIIDNLGPGLRPYVELEVKLTQEMVAFSEIQLVCDSDYSFHFFFDQRTDSEIDLYYREHMITAMHNKRRDSIQGVGELMELLLSYFQVGDGIILRYHYYADLIEII